MKQYIISLVIIKRNQKLLLIRRSDGDVRFKGQYELPGGRVDFGEDPKENVVRDVKQKLGISIESPKLLDVVSYVDQYDNTRQYLLQIFTLTLENNDKIYLSSGHDEFVWEKQSDIRSEDVTDITRVALGLQMPLGISEEPEALSLKAGGSGNYDEIIINTDGGSRGNPGPSASGFVIKDTVGHLIFEGGGYIGITTNNQAEYHAVRLALEKAIQLGARKIQFRLDSQLVVNQLNGVYQIRNRELWPIYANIKSMVGKLDSVKFEHVRREFNKEADAMVNKILDARVN
jgi:ribonuclease HI